MKDLEKFINNEIKLSDIEGNISKRIQNPSFSVVVPCYNSGKTIERTIISILRQTLSDIEIVVVNDASTDVYTLDVLKKLEKYVKVIHLEKNKGLSNARNVGIDNTVADYVLCLDSDDFIDEKYLEKAKKIFDNDESVGVVIPSVKTFGDAETEWTPKAGFDATDILSANRVVVASCVRRKVYDDVGGYDTTMKAYEDWEFWIRVYFSKKNWRFKVIEDICFFYSVKSNSMYHSMTDEDRSEVLSIIYKKHKLEYQKRCRDIFTFLHNGYISYQIYDNNLQQQIKDKDIYIEQLNIELTKKDELINELKNNLDLLNNLIIEKDNFIKEQAEEIDRDLETIKAFKKDILELDELASKREEIMTDLSIKLRQKERIIRVMKSSKFWKARNIYIHYKAGIRQGFRNPSLFGVFAKKRIRKIYNFLIDKNEK